MSDIDNLIREQGIKPCDLDALAGAIPDEDVESMTEERDQIAEALAKMEARIKAADDQRAWDLFFAANRCGAVAAMLWGDDSLAWAAEKADEMMAERAKRIEARKAAK